MREKAAVLLFGILVLVFGMPVFVKADTGPKPSVVITFHGLEKEDYYVTLLSKTAASGPHRVYCPETNEKECNVEAEIWQKFVDYKDKDGYYFLQYFDNCSKTDKFTWGYYPPDKFKILLYFPKEDRFVESDSVYERYAFDSYYKVNAKNFCINKVSQTQEIKAEKDYNSFREWRSFLFRMAVTIILELAVAFFFGYKGKKNTACIISVNIGTQILLNVLLNVLICYEQGFPYLMVYSSLEVLITVIEALIYRRILESEGRNSHPVHYAVAANVVSFGVGLILAQIVPRMF